MRDAPFLLSRTRSEAPRNGLAWVRASERARHWGRASANSMSTLKFPRLSERTSRCADAQNDYVFLTELSMDVLGVLRFLGNGNQPWSPSRFILPTLHPPSSPNLRAPPVPFPTPIFPVVHGWGEPSPASRFPASPGSAGTRFSPPSSPKNSQKNAPHPFRLLSRLFPAFVPPSKSGEAVAGPPHPQKRHSTGTSPCSAAK